MSSIVEDVRPYFSQRNYDLIMGHSLGGVTVMSLFPYLSQSHPTAIVLVDPPLQLGADVLTALGATISKAFINIKSAEAISAEHPLWTHDDSVFRELAIRLCAVDAVNGILKQNQPWNFIHLFNMVSPKWKVTVLIADPAIHQVCFVDDIRPFPHVRPVLMSGSGHWMQSEFPEAVVEEALKTVVELE
jgi:pimeloyl-ACP methyl ester carboxylesterase